MRRITWSFAILLAAVTPAAAQTAPQQRWDAAVSIGFFQGQPDEEIRGWDDWYHEGSYAASIGRYWTTHFKTEFEFAVTGEGRQFTQQFVPVPGVTINYPISVEVFRRQQQSSARAVWQFNDNAWVHPYLNAGVVYEVERSRRWSPEQYYYPPGDPRTVSRVPLNDPLNGESTDRRAGFTIGGGSKFYFSPSGYIHAGIQVTRAKPSTTVTMLTGLGIDF